MLDNAENLKSIIHGLRMSGLGFVDQEALVSIQDAIKKLPTSEQIDAMELSGDDLKRLSEEVGEIIKLIEIYGKRGSEMKQRHKSVKNLPPRYKVLEWRKEMTANSELVRDMIKVSSVLDEHGHASLAQDAIDVAKQIRDGEEAKIEELQVKASEALGDDLLKEAGLGNWIGRQFGKTSGFVGSLTKLLNNLETANQTVNQEYANLDKYISQAHNSGRSDLVQTMQNIKATLEKYYGDTNNVIEVMRSNVQALQNVPEGGGTTTSPQNTEEGQIQEDGSIMFGGKRYVEAPPENTGAPAATTAT